jgi:hypothetical protein
VVQRAALRVFWEGREVEARDDQNVLVTLSSSLVWRPSLSFFLLGSQAAALNQTWNPPTPYP